MPNRSDAPLIIALRYLFLLVFAYALWRYWGWGYGLIALIVMFSTGVPGEHQRILVPISGVVRVALELLLSLFGIWAVFGYFGIAWGVIVLVLQCLYLFLNRRRFQRIAFGRRMTR